MACGEDLGDIIEVAADISLLGVGLGSFAVHSFPDLPEPAGIRLVFVQGTVGIEFYWIGSVVVVVRRIAMAVIRVIVIIVVRIVVPVVREGEIGEVAVSPVSVMAAPVMVIAAAG